MNPASLQGAWKIGTIWGIPIRVHFSWFIIFGLITWSLSTHYFPQAAPDLPAAAHWFKGALAALLLFGSVGFHELAHSYVAMKYRLSIVSITLFIFGGVAQMKGEPPNPRAESRIAIAGPLSSFFLALVFYLGSLFIAEGGKALFSYLAQINLILGVFNLIPGFPMDGGRILRANLWRKTQDYVYATQKASSWGKGIGLIFIFYGVFSIFGGFPGGLWMMLIGWFVYAAAQTSYQQASLQEVLSGVKVKDIMVQEMVSIPPSLSVEEAVNHYFLRHGFGGFPVFDDGRFMGFITLKEIKNIPREGWRQKRVSEILASHNRRWEVPPEASVMKALEMMIREDKGRIVVTQNDSVIGLITRNGIARYMQILGK
jgi:Zn-dependent protease/predicted transcriptional regulator